MIVVKFLIGHLLVAHELCSTAIAVLQSLQAAMDEMRVCLEFTVDV
jgi:hypothetical protein